MFRKFALISTLATYILIFIGGLVRVAGAGLGCPDWPKCFGRWIPPLDVSQIPAGVNAAGFNFTLAWIEYLNRLAGVIVGLLILTTAILALKNFRDKKIIFYPAILAAFFVAIQGWYGSVVVSSQLNPIAVSVHMFLALIIVGLLIYVTQHAYYLESKQTQEKKADFDKTKNWIYVLLAVILIQIITGTQLRSQIEILSEKFPLLFEMEILSRVGVINYLHTIIGLAVTILTIFVVYNLFLKKENLNSFMRLNLILIINMIFVQLAVGVGMEVFGIPPVLQVFHMWIASLFFGVVLMLYIEIKTYRIEND